MRSVTESSAVRARRSICVLYGGKSGEHDVSRRSAASVVRHLDPSKYVLTAIGIDRSGLWHLQRSTCFEKLPGGDEALAIVPSQTVVSIVASKGLRNGTDPLDIDCVFPVLHGTNGEDGKLQGALDTAGLPYVGAGVLGSSASMDKAVAKSLWSGAGLPVLNFRVVDRRSSAEDLTNAAHQLGWPLFVKPCCAGSSLGASRANDLAELQAAVIGALRHDTRALIEPFVDARELECSVIGNADVTVFPPGEVIPSKEHAFYDYEAKYTDPTGARLETVAKVDADTQRRIMDIARSAYAAVRCEGMARVDFFLERSTGRIYLNEINTLPGFTSISMFPRMCQAGGFPYSEILDHLIGLAMSRTASYEALESSKGRTPS